MRGIQKGLYIEQKKNRSVFLMRDGRFIHGRPAAPLSIGEEGSFYPLTAKQKWRLGPIIVPAIAVVAVLLMFFSALLPSEDAFAYVQMEMDSSIEFGVDEAIRVISIRELDEGGQKLIGKLGDWKGEALDKLIERSIAISVNDKTENVTITTAAEKSADTAGIKLEEVVLAASAAAAKRDIDVRVKKATFAQWEKSVEEEIPVGQKVENYTSVESDKKTKKDHDAEIDVDNETKALKTDKSQSRVKNKVSGEEMEVKPEPAANADKGNADKGNASVEKKKPLEKNVEPPAAGKTEKFVPQGKAEKAKPKVNSPKVKAVEKKPEMTPAPNEKAKPAAKGQSGSISKDSKPGKATAEKPKQKLAEKAKLRPKEKAEVQEKQKEGAIAQGKQKEKAKLKGKQEEKPAKAEARISQNQQRKQPAQPLKDKKTGEKEEQK